jgi:hypothetical protein
MLDYTNGNLAGFQSIMVSKPCRNFLRGFFRKNAFRPAILRDSSYEEPIAETAM